MTTVGASVWERDYLLPLRSRGALELWPVRYSWNAVGGPEGAEIAVSGTVAQLWGVLGWLRCPVEITDAKGQRVWWGYVAEVELQTGALTVGLSLDDCWTRVAVAYERKLPGQETAGGRATTLWQLDQAASEEYGVKEKLATMDTATDAEAAQYRDRILADVKWPIPTLTLGGSGEPRATLVCRGWWSTLEWRLYSHAAISEGNPAWPDGFMATGSAGEMRKAQKFALGTDQPFTATRVGVLAAKTAAPPSSLRVGIHADNAGLPGTRLAYHDWTTDEVYRAADNRRYEWLYGDLDTQIALAYGTNYWFHVARADGAGSSEHYYTGYQQSNSYPRGLLLNYDGSNWAEASYGGHSIDIPFIVDGVWTSANLIDSIIASEGEFVTAIDHESASGLYLNPQRFGDLTALGELEKLIETGTTNDRRLLMSVTLANDKTRRLRVFEEPAATAATYRLQLDGTLLDSYGRLIDPCLCPVGVWTTLSEVLPGQFDPAPRVFEHRRVFIERSEYTVATGQLRLYPKGRRMPWDIGGIE
jgi:hypothetical protein